ncbi:hypothetical protein CONCODRAFT_79969 [Conidiobolus coronatus NRRL 28638]|uniref:Galactose oxidase n=1 Tax=Conidiobolus coronatus (strain ATCC 28846 / CBS 209.66 / NRRL 28638) TaxID=796925 RepID=A0A137NZ54_CONC2|nr:hypothetical protein CONCODRAFT_79969 [Conidiobolus coronatus NRRL 28638]|eukprot:KXN67914.1 hypothetical protein CONCODRAFT_79969 [Conidiobolus coronatus NRRL 28638]
MWVILFFSWFLIIIYSCYRPVSFTIRGNKLYTIVSPGKLVHFNFKVYELKVDPTICNVTIVGGYELANIPDGFDLKFIEVPNISQEMHNKLWVRAELTEDIKQYGNTSYINWVGYINLDDMSLKADSSFIKFPTHDKFPVNKYTINTITNEFGSVLYITGGMLYSKKDNTYAYSNSFFKYNFTTREWVDMTYLAYGKLKPLAGHSSVVIDNRYIVILGGYSKKMIYEFERPDYNSLYNLVVFDTFINNWENISIKPNIFDTSIVTMEFDGFSAIVSANKIVVLGGIAGNELNKLDVNPYLGILDYNSKTWAWKEIRNYDGSIFKYWMENGAVIYNNRIIIFSENIPAQVYNMYSQRMESTRGLSGELNNKGSGKPMPTYEVVFIVLGSAILLHTLSYLLYYKYKKNSSSKNNKIKYKGPIQEVWSNPDIDDSNNIIMWDIKKGLSIKMNNPNALYFNELYLKSSNRNISNMIEFD